MLLGVIVLAAATMGLLAVSMGFVLGWANKAFHVDVDPRIEAADEILPGANCGGGGGPSAQNSPLPTWEGKNWVARSPRIETRPDSTWPGVAQRSPIRSPSSRRARSISAFHVSSSR